jgi:hypothetical protein
MRRSVSIHLLLITAAIVTYLLSVRRVEPDELGSYGLVSVLPLTVWIAFGILLVGFSCATVWRSSGWVLPAYVIAVSSMLHGMAALVYEFPRFPWAWKHMGVVDYIQRHLAVDPTIESMNVYHSWPGFFGLGALISDSAGVGYPIALVAWTPLFFNLVYIATLVFIFRTFTSDARWVWTAAMVFTLANWIGQDYFAPQALAYLFFLAVIGVSLRWFSKQDEPVEQRSEILASSIVLIIIVASVVSHQLTPVMIIIATGGLALLGGVRLKWPALVAALVLAVWMIDFAFPFTEEYVPKVFRDLGNLTSRVDSGLIDYGQVDTGQRAVSLASRGLVAAVAGLAGLGFFLGLRKIRWKPALILMASPVVMVGLSSYGNEVLFRAFFFGLPTLSLAVAGVWFARRTAKWVVAVTLPIALAGLLSMSVVALFGNDVMTVFRKGEIEAATYMYEIAPPGSLVIQPSAASPIRFVNYENITEVAVDRYSETAKLRVVGDPAETFERWSLDGDYAASFALLTRSQEASIDRLGTMPAGAFGTIRRSLDESDRFELIYSNDEAWLYQLETG